MKVVINQNHLHLKSLIDNIEDHFQRSSEVLYDQRNQIRVVSFEGEDYVVKSFKVPNIINQLAYRYLRPSKAKRSYEYSLKLGKSYCPEAISYIEHYKGVLLSKSYYISKRYCYDFTIRPVLLDKDFNPDKRKQVLKELAYFTYTLHENNILHNDYSYGNILIKKREAAHKSQEYEFNIVDVNRMQFKKLTLDERLNNFARLSADDDAMEIMMSNYAQHIQKPKESILSKAKFFRDEFTRKRVLKNKMRGR